MKMKKILAAIAACAMSAAMVSMTAFAAPVDAPTSDIDEEPTEIEEPLEPEDPEEPEEPAEPEEPVEVAPAVEKNPGTGNAPIALAVIPVALAAAAVVAKKAK